MSPTDVSERGLESTIVRDMVEAAPSPHGLRWIQGAPKDYDRGHAVDLVQLAAFIEASQPRIASELDLDQDGPTRRRFLDRLQGEITRQGVVPVLRNGIQHGPHTIRLFHGTPSPGNDAAAEAFALNRFSVTRQLRFSLDDTQDSLDLCLFVNGLPVVTFELKNNLTKQTVLDAVEQYRTDRNPRELLFLPGRCVAHFALDDAEARFCTELKGKASWFLPFNQGHRDGAGNPPNPEGIKTDYLWRRILSPESLVEILENYAGPVEETDPESRKKRRKHIFPRYHQLEVVRRLLAHAHQHGVGQRYLIQHSAGSGKSNSIAWLAHQLVGLRREGQELFDSIIVVTDRKVLDQQIRDTIKAFTQVRSTVGHAEKSSRLREMLEGGTKIIVSTVQKFPHVVKEISEDLSSRRFAIVIDEAHSSQGGRTSGELNRAIASDGDLPEDADTFEDELNRMMEGRRIPSNASFFAFTATPKARTLEMFGVAEPGPDGKIRHRPFHGYTMKQAIEEGFILDVLKSWTAVESYYRLVKTVEGDPEYDAKRARRKLRLYVEKHDHAIRIKAEIMVDHFREQVLGLQKIGGEARAMVVCSGIARAIDYFVAFRSYLEQLGSPFKAIVAFSGEHEHGGAKVTESSLNGFPSSEIRTKIKEDPYRVLICADKFQTGYDEPLLHTMYVDKPLSGIRAVQTLSRLNRAHPKKHEVFVLDFQNKAETIEASFADYYRTTLLSEQTDPNMLHDLKGELDAAGVYEPSQVEEVARLVVGNGPIERIHPILDACVAAYAEELDEDGQVQFKGKAKAFLRTYGFLASILPYTIRDWETRSIFLHLLVGKLPAPVEEDLSRGILEAIDMDSYRVEKRAAIKIQLPDAEGEIDPKPATGAGRRPEAEIDLLSNIIKQFNDQFGTLFDDGDRIVRRVTEDIAPAVSRDRAYRNAAQNSDAENARIECERTVQRVVTSQMSDDHELFRQFLNNDEFRRWLTDRVFDITYREREATGS